MVILTTSDLDEYEFAAFQAGAGGFLPDRALRAPEGGHRAGTLRGRVQPVIPADEAGIVVPAAPRPFRVLSTRGMQPASLRA